jgi:prophage antirepressor-like protein
MKNENQNNNLILIENACFHGITCNLYNNDSNETLMTRKQIAEMLNTSDVDIFQVHNKNKELFSDLSFKTGGLGNAPRYLYPEDGIMEICKFINTPNSYKILGVSEQDKSCSHKEGEDLYTVEIDGGAGFVGKFGKEIDEILNLITYPEKSHFVDEQNDNKGVSQIVTSDGIIVENNEMMEFCNEEFGNIRTVLQIDGEVYFVGIDIATALGYVDAYGALKKHVDKEDKLVCQIDSAGQKRDVTVINESGLYTLIISSKLKSAKKFKRWVTSEILPTLRKTGKYIRNDNQETDINKEKITDLERQIRELRNEMAGGHTINNVGSYQSRKKEWLSYTFKRLDTMLELLSKYKETNSAISFIRKCLRNQTCLESPSLSTGIYIVLRVAERLNTQFCVEKYKSLFVYDFGFEARYVLDFVWHSEEARVIFENTLNNIVLSILTDQNIMANQVAQNYA